MLPSGQTVVANPFSKYKNSPNLSGSVGLGDQHRASLNVPARNPFGSVMGENDDSGIFSMGRPSEHGDHLRGPPPPVAAQTGGDHHPFAPAPRGEQSGKSSKEQPSERGRSGMAGIFGDDEPKSAGPESAEAGASVFASGRPFGNDNGLADMFADGPKHEVFGIQSTDALRGSPPGLPAGSPFLPPGGASSVHSGGPSPAPAGSSPQEAIGGQEEPHHASREYAHQSSQEVVQASPQDQHAGSTSKLSSGAERETRNDPFGGVDPFGGDPFKSNDDSTRGPVSSTGPERSTEMGGFRSLGDEPIAGAPLLTTTPLMGGGPFGGGTKRFDTTLSPGTFPPPGAPPSSKGDAPSSEKPAGGFGGMWDDEDGSAPGTDPFRPKEAPLAGAPPPPMMIPPPASSTSSAAPRPPLAPRFGEDKTSGINGPLTFDSSPSDADPFGGGPTIPAGGVALASMFDDSPARTSFERPPPQSSKNNVSDGLPSRKASSDAFPKTSSGDEDFFGRPPQTVCGKPPAAVHRASPAATTPLNGGMGVAVPPPAVTAPTAVAGAPPPVLMQESKRSDMFSDGAGDDFFAEMMATSPVKPSATTAGGRPVASSSLPPASNPFGGPPAEEPAAGATNPFGGPSESPSFLGGPTSAAAGPFGGPGGGKAAPAPGKKSALQDMW